MKINKKTREFLGRIKLFVKVILGLDYLEKSKALKEANRIYITPIDKHSRLQYFYQFSFYADFYQTCKAKDRFIPGTDKTLKMLFFDLAYLPIKYTYDDYFKSVLKSPERALVRKAIKNGFVCKEINYDDYMEDIHTINISKDSRQGMVMTDDYVGRLSPRQAIIKNFGQDISTYGCFNAEGTLVAYYMFEKFGKEIVHTVKGIGHSDYLKYGIMNYLFAFSMDELRKQYPDGSHTLLYGHIDNGGGLSRFKRNVGCQKGYLVIKGNRLFYGELDRFNRYFKLHGDTGLNFYKDYLMGKEPEELMNKINL